MSSGGTITALADQARDPERVSVYLDGEFAFGLSRVLAARYNLYVGRSLSVDEVVALRAADEVERAVQAGLRLLAVRPRSERETRDRLKRKGFGEPAIEAAIERLRGWRYLDDAEFARLWVEHRQVTGPRGRRLLEFELRSKGIDPETVLETVEAADLDEEAAARAVASKHLSRLAGLDPVTRRRRLTGALQRRGFDWDVIRRVLDTLDRGEDLGEGEG
uniref:Regulatory protein RecX n=1 Tax=Thermorudis peleae TaxID=1382356 RepID=A0A831WXI3_9BACT